MKTATLFVALLALSSTYATEESKKGQKRGIFDEGLTLGSHGFDQSSVHLNSGFASHDIHSGFNTNFESTSSHFDHHHGPIDLGSSVHKHITITKKVGIPVPKPYAVTVEKKIPVPVPHPVPVHVDRPYPVHVPKPYPVPVEKPVPYTVEKHIPYPVKVPVKVPFKVPVAVPVPKPYPVTVHKPVPVYVPETVIVKKPVPVFIKSHGDDHSGLSLGGFGGEYGHGSVASGYGAGSEWKSW